MCYFNHEIHVNKGIGCASCHGRVDEMPLMYMQNTLQMEWCLNCHRNPGVNLRPTSEIYNMAWAGPSSDKPVWCADTGVAGPTAQGVSCTTKKPGGGPEVAMMQTMSATPRMQGRSQCPGRRTAAASDVRRRADGERCSGDGDGLCRRAIRSLRSQEAIWAST